MPPAGRPKAFDEIEVLERAMDLFWLHGYTALGVAQLLEGMGISRQSLYDTFGSKRGLFFRAIEHYRDTQLAEALALLNRGGSPLGNVKALLGYFEDLASHGSCRGCLVANSLVELGPHDPEIALLLGGILDVLQKRLEQGLEDAVAKGELSGSKSPRELSRALLNAVLGLAVAGKLRMDRETLRDIHAGTLRMLD
jgi:TetR/AcrR family transcriptional repressor of nem operon